MCRILPGWMEAEQPRLIQPEGMKLLPRATEQSLPLPWEGIALGWGANGSPLPLLQPGRSRASCRSLGGREPLLPSGEVRVPQQGLQVVASGRAQASCRPQLLFGWPSPQLKPLSLPVFPPGERHGGLHPAGQWGDRHGSRLLRTHLCHSHHWRHVSVGDGGHQGQPAGTEGEGGQAEGTVSAEQTSLPPGLCFSPLVPPLQPRDASSGPGPRGPLAT